MVAIVAGTAELLYNCMFLLYLILKVKNSLKVDSLSTWKMHILTVGGGILFLLLILIAKQTG